MFGVEWKVYFSKPVLAATLGGRALLSRSHRGFLFLELSGKVAHDVLYLSRYAESIVKTLYLDYRYEC